MEASLGSFRNPIKFKDQDFNSLLEKCLKSGEMFSDQSFPAEQKSIGMAEDDDPRKAIKWKRPKDISENAVFVEGTIGTTDICQGQLGNCWLLAALSCLTMHHKLFVKVVPPNQSLSNSYAGIFHFRFWQYGEWVEVVVDDRLPVREGRLLFSYSHTRNEYWSALVEKAYAKLMGSYGCLRGGNISEGMEDFTGGIAYSLPVSSHTPRVFWRLLTAALARGSLLSCFIEAKNYKEVNKINADGLIKGHAYAITDTDQVRHEGDEILLLRVRNPWGFVEYRGPWSDKSKEWDAISKEEKERLEMKRREDGEFWMSTDDFCKKFDFVELCSINPDSLVEGKTTEALSPTTSTSKWTINEHEGLWLKGSSAGGSRKYNRSFWKNPQFELVLTEQDQPDEEDEEDEEDGDEDEESGPNEGKKTEKQKMKGKKCTVLVEILQKDRRCKNSVHFLYMGFHIYKVPLELQGMCLDRNFFMKNRPVGRSGKYRAQRAVWRKVHLDPGYYVLVASTYRPNQPGEFFVRIFSKTANSLGTPDFTCTSTYLPVMAAPVAPEDKMRVLRTFDEEAGPDNRLNPRELMTLFNAVLDKDYHLPLDTCRQLIFGEDIKGRASLNRQQTEALLSDLRHLQAIFFQFDEDSSGTMSPFELSAALQAVGMKCDAKVVQLLYERFSSGDLHLPFHNFVAGVTRLRKLFALYESENSCELKDRGINAWLIRFLLL
ncbi:calpain-12 isoform X1 [Hippocampus comes]|uniref:calpain-12 isoform X1 n=1 Tax=Hippocampus comes TaxID=109280 RepID=UPI00094E0AD8|nr:PREDICTED: calpain-2 catalytic subunit-like isoform X1 [Hippocampus comes]